MSWPADQPQNSWLVALTSSKEPACQCRRQKRHKFSPWFRKIPWRRTWRPTPEFLPGESHGQRSLEGYSPWGRRVGHDWSDSTPMHMSMFPYSTFPISKSLHLAQSTYLTLLTQQGAGWTWKCSKSFFYLQKSESVFP